MEPLILQSGIRHGRFAELTRSDGNRLTVGRSYTNDLVITDPHVAAQAVQFEYDEGNWWLRVIDDTNPVILGKQAVTTRVALRSGDKLTIGRTPLTVFFEGHSITPTKSLPWGGRLAIANIHPAMAIALLVVALVLLWAVQYTEGSTDLEWQRLAQENLSLGVLIISWSVLWAIVGLIARQQHAIWIQLALSAGLWVIGPLLDLAVDYLAYPFHIPALQQVFSWVNVSLWLFTLLFLNVLIATNVKRPMLFSGIVMCIGYSLMFGFKAFEKTDDVSPWPTYSSSLKPPSLGLVGGVSADQYWADVEDKLSQSPK